jgi:conjugal transfer pilus assembly protein TraF
MKWLVVLLLIISNVSFALGRQGMFYYERPVKEVEQDEQEQEKPKTSTEVMENLQKIYNEALNTSILRPTHENIYKERMLSMIYIDLAERYQDRAKFVINHEPELNYVLRHPVDHAARRSHDKRIDDAKGDRLRELSKTHGLFFFFSSTCPRSHEFAPTLKRFADRYGFSVVPISLDGGGLSEFPQFKTNNGQAENLNIRSLPAVVAVNPKDNQAKPILVGYGNVSVSELVDKLDFHYKQQTQRISYEAIR